MVNPKDHSTASTVGVIRAARLYSNIVSPPVIFAVLGLALALRELPVLPGLAWAVVYGFFVSLAPILFVLYMLRSGRIADLHMNVRQQRNLPFLVSVITAAAMVGLLNLADGPTLLRCLAVFNILELALLGFINIFWQISIHTTAAMASMLIVGYVYGAAVALMALPLVALVVWARLFLRRHTTAQVLGGLLLGATSVLAMTQVGCFS